jgi:hypothetical protein
MNDNYVTFNPQIPKYNTPISELIIILIVLMYFLEIVISITTGKESLILLGAKWNPGISNGEYWRFLTATLRNGNLIHLLYLEIYLKLICNLYFREGS